MTSNEVVAGVPGVTDERQPEAFPTSPGTEAGQVEQEEGSNAGGGFSREVTSETATPSGEGATHTDPTDPACPAAAAAAATQPAPATAQPDSTAQSKAKPYTPGAALFQVPSDDDDTGDEADEYDGGAGYGFVFFVFWNYLLRNYHHLFFLHYRPTAAATPAPTPAPEPTYQVCLVPCTPASQRCTVRQHHSPSLSLLSLYHISLQTFEEKQKADQAYIENFQWASSKEELINDPDRMRRMRAECAQPVEEKKKKEENTLAHASRVSIETHSRENSATSTTLQVHNIAGEHVREEEIFAALNLEPKQIKLKRWAGSSELYLTLGSVREVKAVLARELPADSFKVKMWANTGMGRSEAGVQKPRDTERRARPNVSALGRHLGRVVKTNDYITKRELKQKEDLLSKSSFSSLSSPSTSLASPSAVSPST